MLNSLQKTYKLQKKPSCGSGKLHRMFMCLVIRTHLGDATLGEAVDLEYDIDAAISSVGETEKPDEVTESNDQEPKELVTEKAAVTQGDKEREVEYDDIFIASAEGMLAFLDKRDSFSLFDHRKEVNSCSLSILL